eukprot:4055072-Pleurochrysis_carterae.AAC.1
MRRQTDKRGMRVGLGRPIEEALDSSFLSTGKDAAGSTRPPSDGKDLDGRHVGAHGGGADRIGHRGVLLAPSHTKRRLVRGTL